MAWFNKLTRQIIKLSWFGILLSSHSASLYGATVVFRADIAYEGACEISFPNEVIFNHGEPILPSAIEAQLPVTTEAFNLTLTKCQGFGLTPKITLVGESTTAYGDAMFLDPVGSTATGYGILLKFQGNEYFQQNDDLAANKEILAIENWDIKTPLSLLNGTLPIKAILSCGNCNKEERVGGDLKANVTFDFQYD
ncbi:TPA: fimbrial protein [Providencia alcalifaciens]|uniref:fimbrial-like protein n=1 Tax=Providencia alcalifaciens TaxID=126385 RepID=UPI002B05C305|nr:fimbrial-like protein [Providencia alcalifaciens]